MSILFLTALVVFLGYPIAFVYSLRAHESGERIRRALTTVSATGLAVVSLLVGQSGVVQEPGCATLRCIGYAGCAAIGIGFSLFLILLEGTRRFIKH
jgi:hypothetical protein